MYKLLKLFSIVVIGLFSVVSPVFAQYDSDGFDVDAVVSEYDTTCPEDTDGNGGDDTTYIKHSSSAFIFNNTSASASTGATIAVDVLT